MCITNKKNILLLFVLFSLVFADVSATAIVGHPANEIFPGTFDTGSYSFPNNLTANNTFYVRSGKVGIGTTSPGASFDVNGGAVFGLTSGARSILNSQGATKDTYLRSGASGGIVVLQDSSLGNVIMVPSGGNVGIGTTNPQSKLNIVGSNILLADWYRHN